MNFTDFINERTVYDSLVNMVAVVSKKADWMYVNDVVQKAYGQKIISQKQHFRLEKELSQISKSARIK
jgi:hypothetical protein